MLLLTSFTPLLLARTPAFVFSYCINLGGISQERDFEKSESLLLCKGNRTRRDLNRPGDENRKSAHKAQCAPYDLRKKPPILYSGRLFAYSKVWGVTRNASGERGHGCACRWDESGFAIARPPSSTSSLGKPMPMRIPNAIAPARASVCMPRRVNASMLRETSAYAV